MWSVECKNVKICPNSDVISSAELGITTFTQTDGNALKCSSPACAPMRNKIRIQGYM